MADNEIVPLLRADTRPHDNWFRDIGLNRTGFDGADGPTRSIRQSGIPSLPVRFESAAVGGNEVGTPQGYPVPLRLSRDDDAKTAIPIGPCGNSSLASAWVLVGLSLCRRGSNQVSCCCQRGWCTELHIGQGGEFPVRGRDRWLHHASTCRADGGGRPSRRGENARLPGPS